MVHSKVEDVSTVSNLQHMKNLSAANLTTDYARSKITLVLNRDCLKAEPLNNRHSHKCCPLSLWSFVTECQLPRCLQSLQSDWFTFGWMQMCTLVSTVLSGRSYKGKLILKITLSHLCTCHESNNALLVLWALPAINKSNLSFQKIRNSVPC